MPLKSGSQVSPLPAFSSPAEGFFPLRGLARLRLRLRWNAWHQYPRKRQENVMWQRNHPQDQPTDTRVKSKTCNSALQAVQVALDRRDNGGDVPTGDDE
jgi:hypothetical protein